MTEIEKWQAVDKVASLSKDKRKVGCCLFPINKKCTYYFAAYNKTPLDLPTRDLEGHTVKEVIHAEIGALIFAEKGEYDLYCTYAPCINCASAIILSNKVKSVHYQSLLNGNDEGLKLLKQANIPCFKDS